MAIKDPLENPIAAQVRKKYGTPNGLGDTWLGISRFGLLNPYAGILRTRSTKSGQIVVRSKFYQQFAPRTAGQIAASQTFANAMTAWGGLTDDQKNQYNIKAKGLAMDGFNVFVKEYMLSH